VVIAVFDADQEIIEAIRGGKVRRYAVLVDRHKDRAMTLALRLVGNRGEAEELVQDAFFRAFRNLEQFRGEAKFSSWFYRILYNVCMTRIQRRRRIDGTVDIQDESTFNARELEPGIQERMEADEVREILQSEIEHLPDAFKVALTLFYVQEMSYEEMAQVLELPLGTVKTNLSRGRTLLRKRVFERMKDEVHAA
jgi:RNA polymerase sigma-70 factor (ECF subfamily)